MYVFRNIPSVPEQDKRYRNQAMEKELKRRRNRRLDILKRFDYRRMKNFDAELEARRLAPPRPTEAPKISVLVKDWRHFREATDLSRVPLERIERTGLVNKKILNSDVASLLHICDAVGKELQADEDDQSRILQRATDLRTAFLHRMAVNRQGTRPPTREKKSSPARHRTLSLAKPKVRATLGTFHKVGSDDMSGLLVTDRGLAPHIHT